jgi:hypothetical protein
MTKRRKPNRSSNSKRRPATGAATRVVKGGQDHASTRVGDAVGTAKQEGVDPRSAAAAAGCCDRRSDRGHGLAGA